MVVGVGPGWLLKAARKSLGPCRPRAPQGPPALADAKCRRRQFLCAGDRLPVEGDAQAVRLRQRSRRDASVFSRGQNERDKPGPFLQG